MVLLSSFNTAKSSHGFQTPKGKGVHQPPAAVGVLFLSSEVISSAAASKIPNNSLEEVGVRLAGQGLLWNCYVTMRTNTDKQTQRVWFTAGLCWSQWFSGLWLIFTFKKANNKNQNLKPSSFLAFIPSLPKKAPPAIDTFSVLQVQKLECSGNTYKREGISNCTLHYKKVFSQT